MFTLLTGSNGFIGKELLKQSLLTYRCVSRNSNNIINNESFYVSSINHKTNWDGAFENCKIVIHLAGIAHGKDKSIENIYSTNYYGTIKLADAAAANNVERFIYLSSFSVIEAFNNNIFAQNSINHYANSKLLCENYLLKLQKNAQWMSSSSAHH